MNKKIISILAVIGILIFIFSCAEKKDSVTVAAHPEGWTTSTSENFHGKIIKESTSKLQNCATCHGADYSGGTSEVSCLNEHCHAVYPHKDGFTDAQSPDFHGLYIASQLAFNIITCERCHGEDYKGDNDESKSCYQSGCHDIYPHDDGFDEEANAAFHGKFIADSLNWTKSSCQSCHGTDYLGEGYTVKNCVVCHDNIYPHASGFEKADAANFHGSYIAETLDFDISGCANCHGTDNKGDNYAEKNCYRCHIIYPHATGFVSPKSDNFHGEYVEGTLSGDVTSCQSCHGSDLKGAGYEEKNCQRCHDLYPHAADYATPGSANFHGDYIAEILDFDLSDCQACHGDDFKGDGNADKNCYKCHELYPHAADFGNEESDNFHGEYIEENLDYDLSSCVDCHGTDYAGNGYEEKNCRACHEEYPHAEGVVDTLSTDFHGKDLAENYDWDGSACESCHGSDYSGEGNEDKNCRTCHDIYPHIDGFANPGLSTYHGEYIIEDLSFDISSCSTCHGNDYSGEGYEEKDCRECHEDYPHSLDFTNNASEDFHGKYIAEEYNWVMDECQECHGDDYAGDGHTEKSCTVCHTGTNGPEDCNTCHGSTQNDAPPPDLAGNSETTNIGVGAHQAHLQDNDISNTNAMGCSACHITPTDYKDTGHLDEIEGADVVFNAFVTDSAATPAQWDHPTANCSDTYCHGAFEFDKDISSYQWVYLDSVIVGNNPLMNWTNVGTGQADCGTCHGLPPTGHNATFGDCDGCHSSVVDENLNIIDKTKHINGEINVYE